MLDTRSDQRRARVEFLPAALEILETPASPVGRAVAATIALFVVIAIGWATLGSIDIVATASGKIMPTGRTKVIQPLEPGIVAAVHVQNTGWRHVQRQCLLPQRPPDADREADQRL